MKLTIPNRRNDSTPRRSVTRPAERDDKQNNASNSRLFDDDELAAVNQAPIALRALQSLPGYLLRTGGSVSRQVAPLTRAGTRQFLRLPLRYRIIVAVLSAAFVIATVSWLGYVLQHQQEKAAETAASTKNGKIPAGKGPEKATPSFSTLTPNGKSIDSLGGWSRVSPPGRDPVYAYTDKIGGVHAIISQQPLPESLSKDPSKQVEELATSYAATDELEVDGTKVYSGVSANGPQSIIFVREKRLILIKADKEIDGAALVKYIEALR